jgi:NAD(P)-dependent dehydrogenase (short-subunit alcohol dehydrogenase family)
MNQTLKDKCALVTGGSRGIGAAIVKRLASEGANVALTYSNSPDRATEVVEAAQASAVHPLAIQAGSADAGAVVAAVERTVSELDALTFSLTMRESWSWDPRHALTNTIAAWSRSFKVRNGALV